MGALVLKFYTGLIVVNLAFCSLAQASPGARVSSEKKLPQNELLHKTNIFSGNGEDPRRTIKREGRNHVFAGVVRIQTTRPLPGFPEIEDSIQAPGMSGTGFMISPCLALTNYHVVFRATEKVRNPSKYSVNVITRFKEGQKGQLTTATPVAWGKMTLEDAGDDWTLLKLDVCIGKRTGWFEIAPMNEKNFGRRNLNLVGFPGDKPSDKVWLSKGCAIMSQYDDFGGPLLHDCSMTSGASGSPIFSVDSDGVPVAFAINSGEFNQTSRIQKEFSVDRANIAVDIGRILPHIIEFLENDWNENGAVNPARYDRGKGVDL